MDLIKAANFRYATKAFDPSKKIPEDSFDQIKALLRLCPSSINGQPWHFIIANSESGKQRIAAGTAGQFEVNNAKIMDASHVVVFCTQTSFSSEQVEAILDQEQADGRLEKEGARDGRAGLMNFFADIHRNDLNDVQHWNEKQVYLNMGSALLAASLLGIDAVPMEGVDVAAINAEFGLDEKGLSAVCAISFGYRAESDFNAHLPKSRLSEDQLFTLLD